MIDFDDPNLDIALSIQAQLGAADAGVVDMALQAIQQRQVTDAAKGLMHAAYLNGFIQEARNQVKVMVADALTASPATQRGTLERVDRLNEQITQAAGQLEALSNG
jgi:hypothetical protein